MYRKPLISLHISDNVCPSVHVSISILENDTFLSLGENSEGCILALLMG
jgi:hypothetical protein